MTDRELLELAAKAAGYNYKPQNRAIVTDGIPANWSPLTDDGDALRLAVDLKLDVMFFLGFGEVHSAHCMMDGDNKIERLGVDDYAATRRAIVRAASEIAQQQA